MRKIYTLMMVLLCATVLSGCMRFTTNVKVKSNGKADISMLYAVSNELAEMGDEDINMALPEGEVAEMEAEGWECKVYSEDNYTGYEMVKENVDLNELAGAFKNSDENESINSDELKVQKKGFTYIIDWKMFKDEQQEQISAYKSYFNMSGGYMNFVLELPYKASNSNATYVSDDGKTLKWDLLAMPAEGIHVEFSLINIKLIIGCIIACVVLLGIIGIVIALIANKKKKEAYALQQSIGYPGTAPMGQNNYMNYQFPVSPTLNQPTNTSKQLQNPSVADEIMKLRNLMESGVITPEEFEAQKKKLLGE